MLDISLVKACGSLPVCVSSGHVCPAGGAVCVADGGPGSERQTDGEQQTAGGAGVRAEGGVNPTVHTGTGNTKCQTLLYIMRPPNVTY